MIDIGYEEYSARGLAERYCISIQQARRYIERFGANRRELDRLLAAAGRTPAHRAAELQRKLIEVASS